MCRNTFILNIPREAWYFKEHTVQSFITWLGLSEADLWFMSFINSNNRYLIDLKWDPTTDVMFSCSFLKVSFIRTRKKIITASKRKQWMSSCFDKGVIFYIENRHQTKIGILHPVGTHTKILFLSFTTF